MEAIGQEELQFRKSLFDHLVGKRLESDNWGCLAMTTDSGKRT